jgi:hypothetical protein
LYYTKIEGDAQLFRSGIDGTGDTEVLSGVSRQGFVVAPDRIYYLREDRDGSIAIRQFLLATGEDSRLASAVKPVFSGLSLSPDGKYLIYSQFRARSNLMLVDDFH